MIKSFSKQKKKILRQPKGRGKKPQVALALSLHSKGCAECCVCYSIYAAKQQKRSILLPFGFFIFIFYVFEYVYVLYVCNAGKSQMWASDHLGLDLKTTVSPCGCWKLMFWEGIYIQTIACFLKSGTIKV